MQPLSASFSFSGNLIRFKQLPQGGIQYLVNTYVEVKLSVLVILEGTGKLGLTLRVVWLQNLG